MKVKLTYFRKSGKYYSGAEYESDKEFIYEMVDEVVLMQARGTLPGLSIHSMGFVVLMEVPEHPHNHPTLIGI